MKIAILSIYFPPKWLGGTEVATLNLARALTKKHNICVLTTTTAELSKLKEDFEMWPIKTLPFAKFSVLDYNIRAANAIRKIRPDIVHCQSTVPALAALLAKRPYVVYCRGSDIYLAGSIMKAINRLVLRRAAKVIVLTKYMQKRVKEDYGVQGEVIPNGIDTKKYRLNREKIRKQLGLNKKFVVLYIGTLKKVKGVEYLIRAFVEVNKKVEDTRLWIVGDGPERMYLERLVKDLRLQNVIFFGKICNDEVPKYAVASDVLVLPSLSEGFPVTILEAMAAGLPIIATNVTGVKEIIKKENGFLVRPKRPKEIAEKLLLLLRNSRFRKRFSRNNLMEAEKYSWQNIVTKLELIYNEALLS